MIWLDPMSIADPVVKLNSFYLIHSLSDLRVELSTNQNPLTASRRQPKSEDIKHQKTNNQLILTDSLHAGGIRETSQCAWKE